MRDEENRPTLAPLGESPHDAMLRRRVQRRRGFVEHEYGRVPHHGAGDRQPLALAAGQSATSVGKYRIETVRETRHIVVHGRNPHRFHHVFVAGVGRRVADVVPHRHREQHILLQGDGDVAAQRIKLVVVKGSTVDCDRTPIGIE